MLAPSSRPWLADETLAEHLEARGYSRRDFLGFCAKLGAVLGLSPVLQSQVVQALESQRRPSVIWLQLQECTGCVESVLRTDSPTHRRPDPRDPLARLPAHADGRCRTAPPSRRASSR